jgi:hypothetical protein
MSVTKFLIDKSQAGPKRTGVDLSLDSFFVHDPQLDFLGSDLRLLQRAPDSIIILFMSLVSPCARL